MTVICHQPASLLFISALHLWHYKESCQKVNLNPSQTVEKIVCGRALKSVSWE